VRIRFAKQAARDIDGATAFWLKRRPDVPLSLVDDVMALAERLARGEFDGPEVRLKTGLVVRSWPLPPYRLYYRRRDDALEIMRIYHQARRPMAK
jgi:plasmid stabilization system protein ParE